MKRRFRRSFYVDWFYLDLLVGMVVLTLMLIIFYLLLKINDEVFEPIVITETETVYVDVPVVEKEVEIVEIVKTETTRFDESTQALLTRLVMSEAGNQDLDCKMAVLWTVQNRVDSDKYPNTYFEVVTQMNQYSLAYNGEPNEDCHKAVALFMEQVEDGIESFPSTMTLFRSDYFHSIGEPYARIDDLYFSCEESEK